MQFSQEADASTYVIRGYGPGEVTISEPISTETIMSWNENSSGPFVNRRTLTSSALIAPKQLITGWRPETVTTLSAGDLHAVTELDPEIVILGTGKKLVWPPLDLLQPLYQSGIGVEVMDTAAACRTYNILMFEGRKVVAALMMI